MATKYSITNEGHYTKIVMQESTVKLAFFSVPKTCSILVRNGTLFINLGTSQPIIKLRRADIIIPSSTDDEDLYNILSGFMTDGSGGTIYGAQSGVNLNGTNFELGVNPLLKDTTIDEAGFALTIQKIAKIAGFNVNTSLLSALSDPVATTKTGLAKFLSIIANNTSAQMGTFGNNVDDAMTYWTATADTKVTRVTNQGNAFRVRQLDGGTEIASLSLISGAWTFTGTSISLNSAIVRMRSSDAFYFGDENANGTIRIGVVSGNFVAQVKTVSGWVNILSAGTGNNTINISDTTQMQRIPLVYDVTGVTLQAMYSIPLAAGFQYAYRLVGNLKKTNAAQGGNIIITGGASRTLGTGASSLHSASPNSQIQESLAGTISFSHAITANVLDIRVIQTDTVKTRFSGYVEILITNIPDTF